MLPLSRSRGSRSQLWLDALARGRPTHDRVTDAHISLLLNLGLLSRHSHTADQYLFAIPSAGPVVKSIIAGRKVTVGPLPSLVSDLQPRPVSICICRLA